MADWLTLSQTGGTGNTTISLTASTNTGATGRNQAYKITANDKVVNVLVVQDDDYKEIRVNPSVVTLTNETTASVDVITDFEWTASTSVSSVTLSQSTGSGNTTITVSCNDTAQTEILKTITVTFSTSNDNAILNIQHLLSTTYITAYYDIVATGNTTICFDLDVDNYCPYISVDNGEWIAYTSTYSFATTGEHNVRFMISKNVKKGNAYIHHQYYVMPTDMFSLYGTETRIKTVVVGEGIERIESLAVDNEYVETIYLPSTLNYVQTNSFYYITSLANVYITARTQPPYISGPNGTYGPFNNIKRNGRLHYPSGSDYSGWLVYQITDPNTGIVYNGLGYYGWTGVADL